MALFFLRAGLGELGRAVRIFGQHCAAHRALSGPPASLSCRAAVSAGQSQNSAANETRVPAKIPSERQGHSTSGNVMVGCRDGSLERSRSRLFVKGWFNSSSKRQTKS
jgi:hypothetical protein